MEQLRPNPEQEIKELKDIVERNEKFETYVLFENKQLKDINERLINVNKQLNKDIKEIADSLLQFQDSLNLIYVTQLKEIVK